MASRSVLVTNRTFERAVEIAKIFEGAAIPFEHFTDHIDHADIVISSTGAPHFIITRPLAEQVIRNRRNKPVFFIDIAVPRDVDPSVNDIDNAFVYDIDDLQQVIDANMKERMKEAGRAEEIVDREVQAFCTRMQSREVAPTIVLLRETCREGPTRGNRTAPTAAPGHAGGSAGGHPRRHRSGHAVADEQDPASPHLPDEGDGE